MKYTFLLPAYKIEFLEKSLQSILSQSFDDFNVIVSDDASPFDIKSIVNKFQDNRLIYRRNDKNIGGGNLVNHWNMLLNHTDAKYIIMASDDDVYEPGYLQLLDNIVNKYPEVDVIRPRIRLIKGDGRCFFEEPEITSDFINKHDYLELFSLEKLKSGISQFIFKRESLLKIGGFVHFPLAWYSDDVTVISLSNNGIAICDKILFSMRYSNVSISSGKQNSEYIKQKIFATCQYAEYIDKELSRDNFSDIKNRLFRRAKFLTLDLILPLSFREFLKYCRIIFKQGSKLFPKYLFLEFLIRWGYYRLIK